MKFVQQYLLKAVLCTEHSRNSCLQGGYIVRSDSPGRSLAFCSENDRTINTHIGTYWVQSRSRYLADSGMDCTLVPSADVVGGRGTDAVAGPVPVTTPTDPELGKATGVLSACNNNATFCQQTKLANASTPLTAGDMKTKLR
jgi:hypothetical protein